MTNHRSGERGSTTFAVAASMVALGVAMFSVQKMQSLTKQTIDDNRMVQSRESVQTGAMNSLAQFKSLLSTRRQADGKYVPALYASNYFSLEWSLTPHPNFKPPAGLTLDSHAGGTFNVASSKSLDFSSVAEIMGGQKHSSGALTPFKVRILRPIFNEDLPLWAEYVRVNVVGEVFENNKKQKVDFDANIPLALPQPESPKIQYKSSGSSAWTTLVKDTDLSGGEKEFRVVASGVAFKADLLVDGAVAMKLAGGDGKGASQANNYGSKDAQIGDSFKLDLGPGTPSESPGDNEVWNEATCSLVGAKGGGVGGGSVPSSTRTLEARVYSIDPSGVPLSTGTLSVKVAAPASEGSSSSLSVGLSAYKTQCLDQCPYVTVNGQDDPTGKSIIDTAVALGRTKDYASRYTYDEALKWKITNKKLCLNFAHVPMSNNTFSFYDARVMLLDVKTCSRKFLFQRLACGCVTADTLITLGDGVTTKRIDELEPSDSVWNPLIKKAFPIRKVTQGPEKVPMIEIMLGSQKIKATGNHPFISKKGAVAAYRLEVGDSLLMGDDKWLKIDSIQALSAGETPPIVWNLEIEAPDHDLDAHQVVANGIATGDLVIQKKLQSSQSALTQIDP